MDFTNKEKLEENGEEISRLLSNESFKGCPFLLINISKDIRA
jgi:hypothetical protein